MSPQLPTRGAVFWPVGTGDSTTLVVDDETVVQVDLHDMAKADDDETPEVPVVDYLVECLPMRDGKPYLAVFALTHADKDHCLGFEDLLSKVTIGELWATPRLWHEFDEDGAPDLCSDARAFQREADRRVNAIRTAIAAGGTPGSGDRIIVIGHDEEHQKYTYGDLPAQYKSGPGHSITAIDGQERAGQFEAFIHAPFASDAAAERNETSLAMQVTLLDESGVDGKLLLFGDLAHDTIMKIFSFSEDKDRPQYLEWDLLLAPHHCSKKVMYLRSLDGEEVLEQDVLTKFEDHRRAGAVVIASSHQVPAEDTDGANPPHRMAADRYMEIADEFLNTMSWLDVNDPSPIVFGVSAQGAGVVRDETVELAAAEALVDDELAVASSRLSLVAAAATLVAKAVHGGGQAPPSGPDAVRTAIVADRGGESAPQTAIGFGR